MSGSYHAVGKVSVNTGEVTSAEWTDDPTDPLKGILKLSCGGEKFAFDITSEGVPELASAVGLSTYASEYTKAVKAKEHAAKAAEKAAADAEHEAAKAAEDEAKKSTAKAHKAHG